LLRRGAPSPYPEALCIRDYTGTDQEKQILILLKSFNGCTGHIDPFDAVTPIQAAIQSNSAVDMIRLLRDVRFWVKSTEIKATFSPIPEYTPILFPTDKTQSIARAFVTPWKPSLHQWWHWRMNNVAITIMRIRNRLEHPTTSNLPLLPPEMWFHILSFIHKSWLC
jgi:hypothetical protein